MERINPETGKPFKRGDVREDGYIFISYKSKAPLRKDGTYKELWLSPEAFDGTCKSRDAHYKNNRQHYRNHQLVKRYGITLEDYDRMFFAQGGRCMICMEAPSPGKILCVDHCHDSGEVRGLLCTQCNTMIGMAERHNHAEEVLKRGAEYVRLLAPHSLPELWEPGRELSLQRSARILPPMPHLHQPSGN